MKVIGLIGGMSWESTAVYYRRLNEEARRRLGGLSSAEILLHSVDFSRIVEQQKRGAWDEAAAELARIAGRLQAAGADMVLICTNTMHKVADAVQAAVKIPVLHIADVTGAAIAGQGYQRPLLLATNYTMEQDFYRDRLKSAHGLETLIPDRDDRAEVHRVIFEELCQGLVRDLSRDVYRRIIARGQQQGADCVILGCTEIGLLIGEQDCCLPMFDSTILHADAGLDRALAA